MSIDLANPYTGLFRSFGTIAQRPHDAAVSLCSATLAPWGARSEALPVGGAGWNPSAAEAACLGEGIERTQACAVAADERLEATFERWPLTEPAVAPERWVLFLNEQYAQAGFPFERFTRQTTCRWVAFRDATRGDVHWVPEDLCFLFKAPSERHRLCPGISTGLSSGRPGLPVVLRGLQEVIERDAAFGGWVGAYELEEHHPKSVLACLGAPIRERVSRPQLRYRFFRVNTPFSAHVTWTTVASDERAGFCFAIGSACRETREQSWSKSLLEALHGLAYVRHLRETGDLPAGGGPPASFQAHAAFYSARPEALWSTVFARPRAGTHGTQAVELLPALVERLGPGRPVLFRSLTPPSIAQLGEGWTVLRVLVPGLQPLHGAHALAQLGGPLWGDRSLAQWEALPPHPFP